MLVGYCRVSTQDQTLGLQIDALTAAGCERIYEETASGGKADRIELRRAIESLKRGDTLVVWKLDRLARSLKQLIATVEELERRGVGFRSLTEQLDTSSAGGRLFFHIFGALAEFERAVIRERTKAGMAAAKARGKVAGRKPSLTSADVKMLRALLRDPDITVVAAAKRLGVSPSTVFRYLPGGRSAVGG
jgi:DNA invertase Pin-like site-specific DNA recombinase